MARWLYNPLTYIALLTLVGLVVKGLFWLRDVHNMKSGWQTFTEEIREDLKEIRQDIKQIFLRLPPRAIESASPVRLTDYGSKMAEFLLAKDWAASVAQAVTHEVVDMQPFQIEEFSRDYVATKLEPEIEERVSACAYEFGTERDAVKPVLWVVLRDELLDRVKGTES